MVCLCLLTSSCGHGGGTTSFPGGPQYAAPFDIQITPPQTMVYIVTQPTTLNTGAEVWTHLATGLGALGIDFDHEHYLSPLPGFSATVTVTAKLSGPPIVTLDVHNLNPLSSDSLDACAPLMTYDSANQQVVFSEATSLVTRVLECQISLRAKGYYGGQEFNDEKYALVIFSPTFERYAYQATFFVPNDPVANHGYQYVSQQSGIRKETLAEELQLMAQWLKTGGAEGGLVTHLSFPQWQDASEEDPIFLHDVDILASLHFTESLDLSETGVSNIGAVKYLSKLKSIDLSNTRIQSHDFYTFYPLKNLKILIVRNVGLKSIGALVTTATALTHLDISENTGILDLEGIHLLKNLQSLKARGIGIHSLKGFWGLTQLTSLDIANNLMTNYSEEDAREIANLYRLEHLDISMTNLDYVWMDQLFLQIQGRGTLKNLLLGTGVLLTVLRPLLLFLLVEMISICALRI